MGAPPPLLAWSHVVSHLTHISQAGCLIGTIGLFMAAIAAICAACGTCQNKKSAEATTTEMTNVATAMPVAQA